MKPHPNEELDRMSKREIIRLYKRTVEQFNDAVPVRHGKWLYGESESGHDGYYCSQCGKHIRWIYGEEDINFIRSYNYCPNCGARMDAERKEE